MQKPKSSDSYDTPPAVTPQYLDALRRRWSAKAADIVTKALKEAA